MPTGPRAPEKPQELPEQKKPADLEFFFKKIQELDPDKILLEYESELEEFQKEFEKMQTDIESRATEIFEQKWQDYVRQAFERVQDDWSVFSPEDFQFSKIYQEITDSFSELCEKGFDNINRRREAVKQAGEKHRQETVSGQLKTEYEQERGALSVSDRERHRQIHETQSRLSNERFLGHLESDPDVKSIAVQLRKHEEIPLTEVGACAGAFSRKESQALALRENLRKKIGDKLEVILPIIQSALDSLQEKQGWDRSILEEPVPIIQVIAAMPEIRREDREEVIAIEKKLAQIETAEQAEALAGSPEWGKTLAQQEINFEFQDNFSVTQGDWGFFYSVSAADYQSLLEKSGVVEVAPGIIRIDQTRTLELGGSIFLMRPELFSNAKIQELERRILENDLIKAGIKEAFQEIVFPEAHNQAEAEFLTERSRLAQEFDNIFLGGITPESPETEIRETIIAAVDAQVVVKMANFQLSLMRILDQPWEGRPSSLQLRASFAEIHNELLSAQGEADEFLDQLRSQGYPEFYIRLAAGRSAGEVQKNLTIVNRVEKSLDNIFRENDTEEIQRDLYRRFRDNSPAQWETEIDVVRRNYKLA